MTVISPQIHLPSLSIIVTVVSLLFLSITTSVLVVNRTTTKTSSASGIESSFVAIIISCAVLPGKKYKLRGGPASRSPSLAVKSETLALELGNIQ